MKNKCGKSSAGFTLVELLVVVALLSIAAAAGSEIFTSIIRSYNKAGILNEIEQNGSYAFSVMTRRIRKAKKIVEPTLGFSESLTVEDALGGQTRFFRKAAAGEGCSNEAVAMQEGVSEVYLTNTDSVKGVSVSSLGFDVSGASPPTVTISLTLSQGCGASSRIDYRAETTLTTTVSLRSY